MFKATKTLVMFSLVMIIVVFTNATKENRYQIDEETAKVPIYTIGAIGEIGNIAGSTLEDMINALDTVTKVNNTITDIKHKVFAIRWLNDYKQQAKTMTKEQFEKFIKEQWENLPWYKKVWYNISTQNTTTAGGYWMSENNAGN